jgi:hypothetical protein
MAARKRALWWTAMVVAGAATLAPPAGAATVTVTRTDDPLPTDGCATNGCSLREAVSAANLGDRVHLPASAEPYTLSDGAGSGPIVIGKDLTVDGDGAGASTISGNAAHRAFNVLSGAAAITVAISDLTIRDGRGGDAPVANQGGAIVVNPTTQPIALNLTAVHLRDNAVTTSAVASYSSGGALSVLGDTGAAGSTITIASSALFGNVAEAGSTSNALGGAIAITVNNAATLNLVNSTLSGNQARIIGTGEGRGGGIALLEDVDGDVQVNLRNSTIAANLANTFNGVGGNLYGEGSSTLSASATIVSGGDAVDPTSDNCKAASIPGNNVENENECGVGAAGKPSSDPQPGPLQDNGGPTSTRAISASSPAIGLGTAASCQAVDQRGVPRPSGGCDAGAFEGAPPGVVTGAATGVFTSVATLNGSVSPFFAAATHQFQYGPTAAYGSTTDLPLPAHRRERLRVHAGPGRHVHDGADRGSASAAPGATHPGRVAHAGAVWVRRRRLRAQRPRRGHRARALRAAHRRSGPLRRGGARVRAARGTGVPGADPPEPHAPALHPALERRGRVVRPDRAGGLEPLPAHRAHGGTQAGPTRVPAGGAGTEFGEPARSAPHARVPDPGAAPALSPAKTPLFTLVPWPPSARSTSAASSSGAARRSSCRR